MQKDTPLHRFPVLWGEIADLRACEENLHWDQETMMPPGGQLARAELLATVAGLRHRALTSEELADTIAANLGSDRIDEVERHQLLEAQHERERATQVPERLVQALAIAGSEGIARWREARDQSDFSIFAPALKRIVELLREEAQTRTVGDHLYDGLLEEYEPRARTADLLPLFDTLGRELSRIVAQVVDSGRVVDESVARGEFPESAQLEFGKWVASTIGFDFDRGRIDASAHPFCSGLAPGDVRITWRSDPEDFRPGLFGILHEAGHGIYEQGLPPEWQRTPLGKARSMGVHESQSRLWENHVGRHAGFWRYVLPRFREAFPAWRPATVEELWPALHRIAPSLIRVEADEVTYNLHVLARFRLELAMVSDDLQVDDLPTAWNDTYNELLGVCPQNDVEGVLQDIHWASGLFGYFPTYTLGSLLSAQLFAAAEADLGDLENSFAGGDFSGLKQWLACHIHQHGSRYTAAELIESATQEPLSSAAFLAYVGTKAERLYGVA